MNATLLRPTESSNINLEPRDLHPDGETICRELDAPAPEKIILFSTVTVLGLVAVMLGWPYVLLVAAGFLGKILLVRHEAKLDMG